MNQRRFTAGELRYLRAKSADRFENMRGARFVRNVDFFLYICMVVLLALSVRLFVCEPIRVVGDSMDPTLIDGEHMLVEKVSYWFEQPARGQIIICYYPGYTESCVKRVVGLPGERVRVQNGAVYINDEALDESAYWTAALNGEMQERLVGEKEVFVMGDNRNFSRDSRREDVGNIPYAKIVGRVRAVIWPMERYRPIEQVNFE